MMMAKNKKKEVRTKKPIGQNRKAAIQKSRDVGGDDIFSWNFSQFDGSSDWGFVAFKREHIDVVMKMVTHFESIGWNAIQRDKKSHGVDVKNSKPALKAWWAYCEGKNMKDDKNTKLFSLRIDSTKRLYGIRDGGIFNVIWYDPHHDLFPSHKKNT